METLDTYLTQLAASSATPGGGSAAMFVGAAGAALLAMVCRICAPNPKFTGKAESAERIIGEADALRARFIAARARDEAAFERVMEAQRMPKTSSSRAELLEEALDQAAAVPLEMAAQALDGLRLADETAGIGNKNLLSDVGCAAEFLHAALVACGYNVRINHTFMKTAQRIADQSQELFRIEREGDQVLRRVRAAVYGGFR